jgi:hypothetical protein
LDYEQYLSEECMDGLSSDEFKPVLSIIQNDPSLLLEIRKGDPIVYYRGCKIMDITTNKKGDLKLSVDSKYARICRRKSSADEFEEIPSRRRLLDSLNANPYDYSLWAEKLDCVKCILSRDSKNVAF